MGNLDISWPVQTDLPCREGCAACIRLYRGPAFTKEPYQWRCCVCDSRGPICSSPAAALDITDTEWLAIASTLDPQPEPAAPDTVHVTCSVSVDKPAPPRTEHDDDYFTALACYARHPVPPTEDEFRRAFVEVYGRLLDHEVRVEEEQTPHAEERAALSKELGRVVYYECKVLPPEPVQYILQERANYVTGKGGTFALARDDLVAQIAIVAQQEAEQSADVTEPADVCAECCDQSAADALRERRPGPGGKVEPAEEATS